MTLCSTFGHPRSHVHSDIKHARVYSYKTLQKSVQYVVRTSHYSKQNQILSHKHMLWLANRITYMKNQKQPGFSLVHLHCSLLAHCCHSLAGSGLPLHVLLLLLTKEECCPTACEQMRKSHSRHSIIGPINSNQSRVVYTQ